MTALYPLHPVLMVDDEVQTLNSFELVLRSANISHLLRCEDSREVIALFAAQEIEVMMLDLSMPHVSGEEILSAVNREYPEVPVIIITGSHEVDTAVRCMKGGPSTTWSNRSR